MKMAVPFRPNVVFIYNPSNGWLFLNTSTYKIPTQTLYDISIPPQSYLIFVPYTPNTEYGGLLVIPGGGAVEWDCWIEFRRGEKEIDWNVTPGFPVIQPLSPLPPPPMIAAFSYAVSPLTVADFQFGQSDYGWSVTAPSVYVLGVGFVATNNVYPVPSTIICQIFSHGIDASIIQMDVTYRPVPGSGTSNITRQLQTTVLPGFTAHETQSSGTTDHSIHTYGAAFDGTPIEGVNVVIGDVVVDEQTIEIAALTLTADPLDGFPFGADVLFTDQTSGAPAFWTWDFGDGSFDLTQNPPVHHYLLDGIYYVTLATQDLDGNLSWTSAYVYVNVVANEVIDYV